MASFSARQVSGIREVFDVYDFHGDGKIYAKEIGEVLRALDENPTQSDIKRITQKYGPDDRITFDEFLVIYEPVKRNRLTDTAEDFIESFRHFDPKGTGLISIENLMELLTGYGEKLTRTEAGELLQGQVDSHGNVNIEKFIKMVMGEEEEEKEPTSRS